MDKLFIDIETVPGGRRPNPEDLIPPKTMSKPETIAAWQENNVDIIFRKRAVDPRENRIICISYAIDDGDIKSIFSATPSDSIISDEGLILGSFINMLSTFSEKEFYSFRVVGHNVEFDWKSILYKLLHYRYETVKVLPKNFKSSRFVDTMKLFTFDAYKEFVSMDYVCKFFGIAGKEGMDGSMVYDAYLEGKMKEIVEYCESDVRKLRMIYNLMI